MPDASEGVLWLVSGGASLVFLAWALVELLRIRRAGESATRRWVMVFLLAMVALVLAGAAQGAAASLTVVVGACFAVGGFALYKAAHTQRKVLEGQLGA